MRVQSHKPTTNILGYKGFSKGRSALIALILTLLICMPTLQTQPAFAAQLPYTCPEMNTVAQAQTDGSLHVAEQRTFILQDEVDVVFWKISGLNSNSEININTVRMASIDSNGIVQGDWISLEEAAFQSDWREPIEEANGISVRESSPSAYSSSAADEVIFPEGNAWSFDKRRGTLYAFFTPTTKHVIFEIDYNAENAVMTFDDVAEIYWDYVPAYNTITENVNTAIQLPVPEGATVNPSENVLAWGHGAPGEVAVNPDGTIQYHVPTVEPDQYAQAHIIFPVSWVNNIDPEIGQLYSGTRYDNAVSEERTWTDTWSNQQIHGFTLNVVMVCICVLALIIAMVLYVVFGRERNLDNTEGPTIYETGQTPSIASESNEGSMLDEAQHLPCTNVSNNTQPAIIGRLMRWNHISNNDIYATAMELEKKGLIQIDNADEPTARIHMGSGVKSANLSPIEHETISLLFDVFAEGYRSTSRVDIEKFKTEHPNQFNEAIEKWQQTLTQEVAEAELFDPTSFKLQRWLAYASIAFGISAILAILMFKNWFAFAILIATTICITLIANYIPRRTPKGAALAKEIEKQEQHAEKELS